MRRSRSARARGHTLIEILIAVAIIVIVAGLVITAMVKLRNLAKAWKRAEAPAARGPAQA